MRPKLGVLVTAGLLVAGLLRVQPEVVRAAQEPAPTFTRDVAPILYKNCVSCHRPGDIAPMSLLTYAEARPWAKAIERQVRDGIMPPWYADAPHGTFANERRLTEADRQTILRWVAADAPQGDPAALPAAPAFADGWRIGTPDVVLSMAEDYAVPAKGTVAYEYFYIPANFSEAKWLRALEVRPGNRALVHHVLVYYQSAAEPGTAAPPLRQPPELARAPRGDAGSRAAQRQFPVRRLIGTYAPGTDPQVFPIDTALKLPAGGVLELQMHYTANGAAATDRTQVGMIFAKDTPREELRAGQFINGQFTIPAGADNHRVDTEVTFVQDALLWGLFPHTHVRGKRWEYVLEMPDGTRRPLLAVPHYDFNWQTYYMFAEPLRLPKGARILASAWYDNSAANRSNPDPRADVKWGDQTWEEMQYTGVLYSLN